MHEFQIKSRNFLFFPLFSASGKYSVVVAGGNANVGYKAKMNFYGGQRRGKHEVKIFNVRLLNESEMC